jgi:hypothetical protein
VISIHAHKNLLLDTEPTESNPRPLRIRGELFWLKAFIVMNSQTMPVFNFSRTFALQLGKIMENFRVVEEC